MYSMKFYKGNYDKNEFYSIMGKFFAERSYRRLMPYLINFSKKEWSLFFIKDTIVGFCGVKVSSDYVEFTDFYTEDNYKTEDLLQFMCTKLFEKYENTNIRVLTKNQNEINIWSSLGFKSLGLKGNYKILTWENNNE